LRSVSCPFSGRLLEQSNFALAAAAKLLSAGAGQSANAKEAGKKRRAKLRRRAFIIESPADGREVDVR